MKPDSSLLLRVSFRALFAGIALCLVATAADAQAAGTAVQIASDVIAAEPCLVAVRVTASDANGPITSLTADLSSLPQGNDATFVTDATNTTGTLIWHPAPGDLSGFVVFTATANGQSASAAEVLDVPRYIFQATGGFQWFPTVADIGNYTIAFTATDSDGETETLVWPLTVISEPGAAAPNPAPNRRLTAEAPSRGPIIGITGCGSCGGEGAETDTVNVSSPVYQYFSIGISVTDPDAKSIVSLTADLTGLPSGNTATFTARLGATARAGGPYSGVAGVPVQFDGSASSGFPLTWDFGDSEIGDGATPSHTYALPGTYRVTLVAGGPDADARVTLGDCDVTSVVISGDLPARAFVVGGHRSTPDSPGGLPFCIQLEPVNGDYDNADVDLSTIRMISGMPGSTAFIAATSLKTTLIADRDRNGIQEITVCFRREDVRSFLEGTQGRQTVPVSIVAELRTGGTLQANLELRLIGAGNSLAGSVLPNPLRQTGVVAFQTSKPGPIKVLLFDLSGRLVRTLMDRPQEASGRHEIPIDGRDASGRKLASGIYWYRVQAPEGVANGRLMILE